jgi:hypothetical protein
LPDVLEFRDIDKPVVNDDEVLVRVHMGVRNAPQEMPVADIDGDGVGLSKPATFAKSSPSGR